MSFKQPHATAPSSLAMSQQRASACLELYFLWSSAGPHPSLTQEAATSEKEDQLSSSCQPCPMIPEFIFLSDVISLCT